MTTPARSATVVRLRRVLGRYFSAEPANGDPTDTTEREPMEPRQDRPRSAVRRCRPGLGIPAGAWAHPTGERPDPQWVHFNERAG